MPRVHSRLHGGWRWRRSSQRSGIGRSRSCRVRTQTGQQIQEDATLACKVRLAAGAELGLGAMSSLGHKSGPAATGKLLPRLVAPGKPRTQPTAR